MSLNLGRLRGAAGPLLCALMLVVCAAGTAAAKGQGWKGDKGGKHALKRHQKSERRDLRRHQRLERSHLRSRRRDDRRDGSWWGNNRRRVARRGSFDDRNGRLHYSTGRGSFRDRGRRPNLARRNRL